MQTQLIAKKAKLYAIDAYKVAQEAGMGSRINTIMQVCFFAISKVLPRDEAIEAIRESIRHTYGRKGEDVVQKNMQAVDATLAHLFEVKIPDAVSSKSEIPDSFPGAPKFEHDVLGTIYAGRGDELPVSAFSCDGTFPTGTAKWEKRNLALEIPAWDSKICIQCGKCAMVCPHAVIRDQGLRQQRTGTRAGNVQILRRARQRVGRHEVHDPGRAGRLHRMRRLRRCLPGQEQE